MQAVDAMTPNPRALPPEATLADAIHLLRLQHVRHLPVIANGRVLGILSDSGLRALALGAVLDDDDETVDARLAQPIGSLMHKNVVTVTPETELRRVVELLIDENIGAVPVVDADAGQLVGIVSTV